MTRLLVLGVVLHVHRRLRLSDPQRGVEQGFTLASAISIFVLVLLAVGIVGALLQSSALMSNPPSPVR